MVTFFTKYTFSKLFENILKFPYINCFHFNKYLPKSFFSKNHFKLINHLKGLYKIIPIYNSCRKSEL